MGNEQHLMASSECFYIETDLSFIKKVGMNVDQFLILLVEKGTARVAVGTDEYSLDVSRILVLRPHLSVKLLKSSGGFRATLMGFPFRLLHERTHRIEPKFFLFLYTRAVWNLNGHNRELITHFKELFRFAVTEAETFRRDLVLSLITGFVFGFYETCGNVWEGMDFSDSFRSRELFRKFIQLLQEHYKMQHEVQFYAGELCISSKYLTQITKRMISRTPKQIIDELLVHEATMLLERNDFSIMEISNKLGFADQSYFGRFFKRMMNTSPQQYRVRPKV